MWYIVGLCGVSVCGETTLVISNSVAQHLEWKSFGLRVSAEEHSLPSGVDQCTIKVMVSIAGHYEFPENAHLVSAVFWFQCKPLCKFRKPITIQVQHCAKPENAAKLKFVKAFCTQKALPYSFKYVEGGYFHASSSYGVLDLRSFSGIAVTQEGSEDRLYCAKLYYLTPHILLPQEHQHGIDLVVSWETDVHMKVSNMQGAYSVIYLEGGPGDIPLTSFPLPTRNFQTTTIIFVIFSLIIIIMCMVSEATKSSIRCRKFQKFSWGSVPPDRPSLACYNFPPLPKNPV